jgi:valyl-tRNA synthetase
MRSQDVRFDEAKIESYQRFANKIWNITRLVLGATEGVAVRPLEEIPAADLDPFERWALSRLDAVTADVTADLEDYRPGDAVARLYDFAWHEIADWYLEAVKPSFRLDPTDPGRIRAASVAMNVVRRLALLLHPFMPFVTEVVWSKLPAGDEPIQAHRADSIWPAAGDFGDTDLDRQMAALFEVVTRIRDGAKDIGAGVRQPITASIRRVAADRATPLVDSDYGRAAIARLAQVEFADDVPGARTLVVNGLEIRLGERKGTGADAATPADHAALERDVTATRSKISRLEQQLANQQFVRKANPEVVQRARDDLAAARERLTILEDAFSRA